MSLQLAQAAVDLAEVVQSLETPLLGLAVAAARTPRNGCSRPRLLEQ
jgi:hypothetical protein